MLEGSETRGSMCAEGASVSCLLAARCGDHTRKLQGLGIKVEEFVPI